MKEKRPAEWWSDRTTECFNGWMIELWIFDKTLLCLTHPIGGAHVAVQFVALNLRWDLVAACGSYKRLAGGAIGAAWQCSAASPLPGVQAWNKQKPNLVPQKRIGAGSVTETGTGSEPRTRSEPDRNPIGTGSEPNQKKIQNGSETCCFANGPLFCLLLFCIRTGATRGMGLKAKNDSGGPNLSKHV